MRWGRPEKAAAVAMLVMAFIVVPGTASQATARANLRNARARLDALTHRLQVVDEAYDQAVIELSRTKTRVQLLQHEVGRAQQTLDRARRVVSAASVTAYIESGNPAMAIMNANDVVSLAERLDFLDTVTARNADLALRASIAKRRAARVRGRLQTTVVSENETVRRLGSMRSELQRGAAQAEALIRSIESSSTPRPESRGASRASIRLPIASSPGAQKAIDAAYSVMGTPYRYGGASPSEGFDCSGLTMWAWSHAGVSLPHSSQAQYESIPHVSRSELEPGDLVFFYHPISHVGMYVGNGRMIEAPHPGDHVKVIDVYWNSYVGGGRPGV